MQNVQPTLFLCHSERSIAETKNLHINESVVYILFGKKQNFFEEAGSPPPPLHSPLPRALIPCKHKTRLAKTNAVAEATNYVTVLTKADTEKEMELLCVGFAFVFANLRFVCYGTNAMRI